MKKSQQNALDLIKSGGVIFDNVNPVSKEIMDQIKAETKRGLFFGIDFGSGKDFTVEYYQKDGVIFIESIK